MTSISLIKDKTIIDFEGRVAVVTGAASGIGLATATRFAEEGMQVVMADIQDDALDAEVFALRRAGYEITGVHTDVSRYEQIESRPLGQSMLPARSMLSTIMPAWYEQAPWRNPASRTGSGFWAYP